MRAWYYRHYWYLYMAVVQVALSVITWRWQVWAGQLWMSWLVHGKESPWLT